MGVPSAGDTVLIEKQVKLLKQAILAMSDELEWDEATYQPVAGRAGVVTEVEGGFTGTVTVRIKEMDMVVTVPCRSVSLPPSASPSSSAHPSPTHSPQTRAPEEIKLVAIKEGQQATLSSDVSFIKREVAKYPDDLDWDDDTYLPVVGRQVLVAEIDDGMADVSLTDAPDTRVTVPVSVLLPSGAPSSSPLRLAPQRGNVKSTPAPPKVSTPLSTGPCQKEFKTGMRVSINSNKQILKSMVGFHAELEWDEEEIGSCAGQTAVVVGVESDLLDLKIEEYCRQISLPKRAVEIVEDPQGKKAPPGFAPPGSALSMGDSVTITSNISKLKAEVKKFPEDVEWDDTVYLPCLGGKGEIVAMDEPGLADVKLQANENSITVPVSCLVASVRPPALVSAKAPYRHHQPGMSEFVNLTSDKDALRALLPEHVDKAGSTGRVVTWTQETNVYEVKLDGTKEVITVPGEALQKPAKWPVGPGARKSGQHVRVLKEGQNVFVKSDGAALESQCKAITSLAWSDSIAAMCGKSAVVKTTGPEVTEVTYEGKTYTLPTKCLSAREGTHKAPAPSAVRPAHSSRPTESKETTDAEKNRLCCVLQ